MPLLVFMYSLARMTSITSFAATSERLRAFQNITHGLGHADANVFREPRVGHVGRADAKREATEHARHAGVRVGADHDLARQRQVFDDRVVADRFRAAFGILAVKLNPLLAW